MSQTSIEVEADSIEDAREKASSLIPPGSVWLSESIVSDGKPKTAQFAAETIEYALTKAHDEIPKDASILEQNVIKRPKIETVIVEGMDESSIRQRIIDKYGDAISVKTLHVLKKGSRGLLGIGAKPNQYEVTILFLAVVEITHKSKVRLIVDLVDIETRAQQLIRDLSFHSPEVAIHTSKIADIEAKINALEDTMHRGMRLRLFDRAALNAEILDLEAQIEMLQRQKPSPDTDLDLSVAKVMLSRALRPFRDDLKKGLSQAQERLAQAQEREREGEIRSQAALKLGELGHPVAIEALATALNDEYSSVQINASIALGRFGDKRAVKILTEKLRSYESYIGRDWRVENTVVNLVDATQSLLNLSAQTLGTEDLESLAQLKDLQNIDIEYVGEMNSEADDPYINTETHAETIILSTKSLSPIRVLAQQELTRRIGKD